MDKAGAVVLMVGGGGGRTRWRGVYSTSFSDPHIVHNLIHHYTWYRA